MNFLQGGFLGVDPNSTPEMLNQRRQRLGNVMSGRSNTAAEGLARLIIGGAGGIKNRNMDRFENEKRTEATGLFDRIVNGSGGNQVSTRSAPVSGSVAPPPVSTGPIPDTPASVAADTRSALGMDSIMPASLVQTESGGNFGALNNEMGHGGVAGHGGRAQFGHARLQDAASAGLIPAGTTPQQFAQMPPATQIAVENWHFGDIDKAIDETGAIGRNINGVQVTRDGLRSVAHLGGIGGMRRYIDSNGQYNPSDSFGTSLSDYATTHSGGGSAAPAQQSTASQAELMQVMSNPWLSNEQKSVLGAMLSQAQQNADPMRQIQLERARLELENARNPGAASGANLPSSVVELQWRAAQAGLQPGTPEYQEFVLNGGADPNNFRALDMQAQAAGYQPGTPQYAEFMATRGAGQQAFARTAGQNAADIQSGGQAAAVVAEGRAEGAARAESASELREMQRNMPGLVSVVDQLDALSETATYTGVGRAYNEARKQLGLEATEGAISRAEYIATVDNQVLPLLRQTFGAAFTAKEGESLRATLGDPNKTPAEKQVVLRAFIQQKERDLVARGGVMPNAEVPQLSEDDLRYLELN